MIVRISSAEDIKAAYDAVSSAFGGLQRRVDVDAYLDKISKYANVYAMSVDDDICAFAAMYANDFENHTAYITLIGVKPDSQHSGCGTEMFRFCEEEAKQNGMKTLRLEVDKDNENAVRFYKKQGMKLEKEASQNSMYMKKSLGGET